eukprot:TRINITY_DN15853_c0_g1_i1.p1 TRINITY_DN15853_c0_g1~~TRINITY_DN15853_c0_g1_i1.p1  ORF type:complete len:64 (-),score=9.54 TRINITY_DN15853_c0_g1_i1:31-222(-)
MSHAHMRDAILECDTSTISAEVCSSLINFVPTQEEVSVVQTYEGDENLLGEAEKFFRTLWPLV